ncbi:16S rRNA processing protein RimM [Paenibacillus sp. FSL R7-0273]|uniref:ribosome maturation factor RimM n=1 Tax=Paenibacillus sp. FSL R7-0273 TaxID=1536772 RepID=UPI0004F8132C|nr:ribosome maturation factor RimM [Paenibacillus sp. FSL R7-0273]AIQ47892.1 16S rRNA processing protein RimM [Paenibacillus sp. FSL R7-0273]OMF94556.1 ribosome maturation factor RimM [Paenibacillus sp. FSL R7-0273]
MAEELTVGRLVNTHGIRGEIKILSHTDFPEVRFAPGKKMTVIPADGSPRFEVTVESAREHKGMYIAKLKGYTNINQIEKYKGSMLKVPGDDLVELPENEYYFHHIVGCEVYTDQDLDKPLGIITDILQPGANDVWVVKPAKGQDILIPVIDDVVLDVDTAAKKITVHLMEGLLP